MHRPVVDTFSSYLGGPGFKQPPGTGYAKVYNDFPQQLQPNSGIVTQIRPRPFPLTSLPSNYSLITPFTALHSKLQTVPLTESQLNTVKTSQRAPADPPLQY